MQTNRWTGHKDTHTRQQTVMYIPKHRLDRTTHRQQPERLLDRTTHTQTDSQTDRDTATEPPLTAGGVESFVQRGDLYGTRHGGLVGDVGQQEAGDAVQAGVSHGRGGGGHRGLGRRPGPVDQPVDGGLGVAPHGAAQEGGLVGLRRVQPLDRGRGEASWGNEVWIRMIDLWHFTVTLLPFPFVLLFCLV